LWHYIVAFIIMQVLTVRLRRAPPVQRTFFNILFHLNQRIDRADVYGNGPYSAAQHVDIIIKVGSGESCLPRHHPHCRPSFLELSGGGCRGGRVW
jgi:hypothetical protein